MGVLLECRSAVRLDGAAVCRRPGVRRVRHGVHRPGEEDPPLRRDRLGRRHGLADLEGAAGDRDPARRGRAVEGCRRTNGWKAAAGHRGAVLRADRAVRGAADRGLARPLERGIRRTDDGSPAGAEEAGPAVRFDYDVVVIGSGFGGSVSALRLTEKGYKVAVLEAGARFEDPGFAKTSWDLGRFLFAPRFGWYGIQRISALRDVIILSGAGVGGGSLVYANTLYEPLPAFY